MKNLNQFGVITITTFLFITSGTELKAQWNAGWYPGGFNSQTLGAPNVINAAPWAVGGNKIVSTTTFASGWNNYTCGTDDGAPFSLMANGVPLINMTGNQIGMGANLWPTVPGCFLDIKGTGSNFRIYGDASGKLESTTDLNVNYGANSNNLGGIYFNQGGVNITPVLRFQIDGNGNGRFFKALQVDNQVTAGSFGFTPPTTSKFIANAQVAGEGGLMVYADKGNNALYVANSAGAGRFRMWVNAGGGDDSKLHMSGSAQFGFYQGTGMMDNTTRLNVDAINTHGVKVSAGSPNSSYKAFYVENNLGSSIATAFEVLENGTTHIGYWRPDAGGPSASAALTVDGMILSKEVRVSVSQGSGKDWADYVFARNYKLMPLEKVKEFTKTEKHLPGIPSQKELQETGLDLGDMQKRQMEKIEELYLYVMQLQEQVDQLKKENTELGKKSH